ncbi:hypothetical protein [Okeania sp. SIO2G4]|uniref:hypothetical protein n=1 Tax=unclassified Okeania TaxID=2634635 RepID=UPI0035C8CC82
MASGISPISIRFGFIVAFENTSAQRAGLVIAPWNWNDLITYPTLCALHYPIYKKALKKGIFHLPMSEIKIPTSQTEIIEARIIPKISFYIIEIVYEKSE